MWLVHTLFSLTFKSLYKGGQVAIIILNLGLWIQASALLLSLSKKVGPIPGFLINFTVRTTDPPSPHSTYFARMQRQVSPLPIGDYALCSLSTSHLSTSSLGKPCHCFCLTNFLSQGLWLVALFFAIGCTGSRVRRAWTFCIICAAKDVCQHQQLSTGGHNADATP